VAGCYNTKGRVNEQCTVEHDAGYAGGGVQCIVGNAAAGVWQVTAAALNDKYCDADTASCGDDGPGGKIPCAKHRPLDLSLFGSVDCDASTKWDDTCTTTPAPGYVGGEVACSSGRKYVVSVAPALIPQFCVSSTPKTGDLPIDASTHYYTVNSFGPSALGETASVSFTPGYGRGSVTCSVNGAGAAVWDVKMAISTPCFVSDETLHDEVANANTIESYSCKGVTTNGAQCPLTMKFGFVDGKITCNTGTGKFDVDAGIFAPTFSPTPVPTQYPTAVPTPRPSSLPTPAFETLVVMQSSLSFNGQTLAQLQAKKAEIAASIEASYLLQGIKITVPLDEITFQSNRRLSFTEPPGPDGQQKRRRLSGVSVNFNLQVSLEQNPAVGTDTSQIANQASAASTAASATPA
jgi:hypothetical protein